MGLGTEEDFQVVWLKCILLTPFNYRWLRMCFDNLFSIVSRSIIGMSVTFVPSFGTGISSSFNIRRESVTRFSVILLTCFSTFLLCLVLKIFESYTSILIPFSVFLLFIKEF